MNNPLAYYKDTYTFWFRIFGYGLLFRDTEDPEYCELYSHRNRLGCIKIGKYIVKWLHR